MQRKQYVLLGFIKNGLKSAFCSNSLVYRIRSQVVRLKPPYFSVFVHIRNKNSIRLVFIEKNVLKVVYFATIFGIIE